MRSLEFPYTLYRGSYVPAIPLHIQHVGRWFRVWAYVDSGATYSIFAKHVATGIGIDLGNAVQRFIIVGDGSFIPASFVKLAMRISDFELEGEIGFSDRLGIGFNLLGRKDVFENFRICFDDSKKVVSFHQNNEQS